MKDMTVEQHADGYAEARSTVETREAVKEAYIAGARETLRDLWEKNKHVPEEGMGDLRLSLESFMGMSRLSLIGPAHHAVMVLMEHLKNPPTDASLVIVAAVVMLHQNHPEVFPKYQEYLEKRMGQLGISIPDSPSRN